MLSICQGSSLCESHGGTGALEPWSPAFGRQRKFVWTHAEGRSEVMQNLLDRFVLTGEPLQETQTGVGSGTESVKMCVEMEEE